MSETSKSDSSKADKPGTDKPKSDKPKTDKPKVERAKGPLDAFRDFVGQWERGVNQSANEAMGNEQFSRLMHGVTSTAAGARAGLGEAMERYLATLNLPSRADITNIMIPAAGEIKVSVEVWNTIAAPETRLDSEFWLFVSAE